MDNDKGTVEIDGYQLGYQIEGKGLPAIVIGSCIFYPRVFSQQLRNKLRLIFIDHRGFAKPPNREITTDDFSLQVLIEDVEAIRKFLGIEKCLVIGQSGHAFMALEYSKKYAAHVIGTILIAVSPDYSEKSHRAFNSYFEKTASTERKRHHDRQMSLLPGLIENDPDNRFVHFCLCNGARNWYQFDFDAAKLWEGIDVNMQMIDYVWGVVFRDIDIKNNLENFRTPVLLLLGKYDFVTGPPELWNDTRKKFIDLQMHVFEKSGHYPMLEEPQSFDKEVINWMEQKSLAV